MIISPPFLTVRRNNQTDAEYVAACMAGDSPGAGSYPVSHRLSWHGGLHLTAPAGTSRHLPVRAIADGTVVLVRQPAKKPADADAQRKHALGYYRGWTDNGVVVIRHETEIGEGADAQVTFYSVYQHLRTIRPAIREGQCVDRKAEIGQAGYIYGDPNRIQLEIVCDDANLRRLVGRTDGDVPLSADGRTDSVYGELYFALPEGTRILDSSPHARRQRGAPAPPAPVEVHITTGALFIGIRYANGDATITTYPANSGRGTIGSRTDADYEFELQAEATRLYPDCPSAGYELLRFGRVLGPDALAPQDAGHWRRIHYPGGEGWVNLNATGVRKFSDSDFPHWRGWFLIDDDTTIDSRCNSRSIIRLLDLDDDGTATREEAERRLPLAPIHAFMKRLVCKFPSEWDAANLELRWGWLRRDSGQAASSKTFVAEAETLSEADFDRLCAHLKELSFWDTKIGIEGKHWHFEPREFIANFRECGWLSTDELQRVIPDASRTNVQRFQSALNAVTNKYLGVSCIRRSHFLGQVAHETGELSGPMVERGNSRASREYETDAFFFTGPDTYTYMRPATGYEKRGNTLGNEYAPAGTGDGIKFRGRGSLQITGRAHYASYWVYRGWLDSATFDASWWSRSGWWDAPRDPDIRPAIIDDPQRISARQVGNEYNPIDVGGFFWAEKKINSACDPESTTNSAATHANYVSRIINRYDTPTFPGRRSRVETAKGVLCDGT